MALEQFYQTFLEELAVWLKDRKPPSLEEVAEVAELADDYLLTRKSTSGQQIRRLEPKRPS